MSCLEHVQEIRGQFEEEERAGCMRRVTKAELEKEYRQQVCVAALGAIETHGVKVNPPIILACRASET